MIAVVIPVFNEEEYIGDVLDSVFRERDRYDLIKKIVVVNNQSTDKTKSIVEQYSDVALLEGDGSISGARNLGANSSTEEIVAFIDGDCLVEDGWSKAAVDLTLREQALWPNIVFGSAVKVPIKPTWIESVWFNPISNQSKAINHINSGNMLISKSLFDRLGGFDVNLATSEDVDLSQRAKAIGAALIEDEDVGVIHLGFPKDIQNFFCREFWHGKGMLGSSSVFNNKALALSFLNTVLLCFAVIGFFFSPIMFLAVLFIQLLLLFILGVRLCRPSSLIGFFQSGFLMWVYSLARMLALWNAFFKRAGKNESAS